MTVSSLMAPLDVIQRFGRHDFSIDGFFGCRLGQLATSPMVEYQDSVMRWQDCANQADRAVGWLQQRGIGEGDRVGLMAYNHPATVVLLLACARLGAIVVPCNPEFEAREARYIFEHAGVSGVVCSPEAAGRVQEAIAAVQPKPWQIVIEEAFGDEAALTDQWAQAAPDATTRRGHADSTC